MYFQLVRFSCRHFVEHVWYIRAVCLLLMVYWLLFCAEFRDMPSAVAYTFAGIRIGIYALLVLDILLRLACKGRHFEGQDVFFGVPLKLAEAVTMSGVWIDVHKLEVGGGGVTYIYR